MWKYSKSSTYRPEENGVARIMRFFTKDTSSTVLRIGTALFLAAIASVLAWLSSLASKPASTIDVSHREVPREQQAEVPKPAVSDSTNSIDTNMQVTQSDAAKGPAVETKLNVNSQSIPIPDNGSVHKVIQNDNGTTTVDVSVGSQNSGSSEKSTSMNIEVNSSSQTESAAGDKEGP